MTVSTTREFCNQVIYAGESEDVNRRVDSSHHKWECFHSECDTDPYAAFGRMAGSTQSQRREVELAVVEQYDPPCNG